ncbi:MAG: Ig-like domain-containing protein [Actinomycetes bacterium]
MPIEPVRALLKFLTPTALRRLRWSGDHPQSPRQRAAVGVVAVVLAGALAACEPALASGPEDGPAGAGAAAVATPEVMSTPSDGAGNVRPDAPVRVSVSRGSFVDVHLAAVGGEEIAGTLSADKRSWSSTAPLQPASRYTMTARVVDAAGHESTKSTAFTTLTPQRTLTATILPRNGWTVGVGMPVVVDLDAAVKDRAAVERRLHVTTTPQVEGAWRWVSDRQVQWRPREFWASGTTVAVTADLAGVEAAPGIWGVKDRSATFSVGSAMVSTVDIAGHTMTVTKDGALLRTIPITTGKAGYETRNGTKVIMSRETEHRMDAATLGTDKNDPNYYNVVVKYAMRLTWSGEFIHAAPWSVDQQGAANVSHGCTGLSTADAQWLFERSKVGDVVTFVGGSRELEQGNGYTAWELPFDTWAAGSAL